MADNGKAPAGGAAAYSIDKESFGKRLKMLYGHWAKHKDDLWGGSHALAIATPPPSDDLRYLKSSALNIWLVGYEFPDTIMVFTKKHIHVLCSQKKASLLEVVKKTAKDVAGVEVVMHVKAKNADGVALMESIFRAIDAQSKVDGGDTPVVGHIAKEVPEGNLLETWDEKLKNSSFQLRDVAGGFSDLFAVKDGVEVMNLKKAAHLTASVMKHFVVPKLEKVIDEEKKVSHSSLMEDTEKEESNMAEGKILAVKDAAHRLQLGLLEGIQDENKLIIAGSLLSRDDYQDVVTERSIAKLCGYPLCSNTLPLEASKKGRYRISLKEHKVYDLQETHMYCSTGCVINSRAFALSLQEERSSSLDPTKLTELVRFFESSSLDDSTEDPVGGINSRLSALKIHETVDPKAEELTLEDWIGPSNAIEGYVPQKDSTLNQQVGNKLDKGRKYEEADYFFSEVDFTSTISFNDEYVVSKDPDTKNACSVGSRPQKGKAKSKSIKDDTKNVIKEQPKKQKRRAKEKVDDLSKDMNTKGFISDDLGAETSETQDENADHLNSTALKSSLKSSVGTKEIRSVTWADEKTDGGSSKSLCDFSDGTSGRPSTIEMEEDEGSSRFLSAEACARALAEAAEAVASGDHDVSKAMSEAGILVLPSAVEGGEYGVLDKLDTVDSEPYSLKWPTRASSSESEVLESRDSWYDKPPEGFELKLSPFATMYMSLFSWTSALSLAYIYEDDESRYEEYMFINGREYTRKAIAPDGRSLEIKQALASCLARALPGLVTDLRLPVPISFLETNMGHLLDTMSFMDALPPFTMKELQLLSLLFLDALSVCRIPALIPYMNGRRSFLPRVCEGVQISTEEYDIMRDLLIPLRRAPQSGMQNGA